jgi:phage protein D
MAERRTVTLGYAPMYEVRVEGTRLREDLMRHVRSVEVTQSVDGADELSMEVDATDKGREVRDLMDAYPFAEGNSVQVQAGYESEALTHLGRFDLQVPEVAGDASGRSLTVVGLSAAARLLSVQVARQYAADVGTRQIVEEVAYTSGLTPRVSGVFMPRKDAVLKKAGESDWQLLTWLAANTQTLDGLELRWYVRWDAAANGGEGADVLVFEPHEFGRGQERQYVFRYEDDVAALAPLRSFRVSADLKGMATRLVLTYFSRFVNEEREIVVDAADATKAPTVVWSGAKGAGGETIEGEIEDGAAVRVAAGDPWEERNPAPLVFDDDAAAVTWARRWFRRRQEAFCEADFTVVGMPDVRPWDVHLFRGMSARFDGAYMVTSVRHRLASDGGYYMDLTANKVPSEAGFPQGLRL